MPRPERMHAITAGEVAKEVPTGLRIHGAHEESPPWNFVFWSAGPKHRFRRGTSVPATFRCQVLVCLGPEVDGFDPALQPLSNSNFRKENPPTQANERQTLNGLEPIQMATADTEQLGTLMGG
ncbi:hypothetical protein JCM17478_19830 [Thermopirellula anaerolimosa]